MRIQSALRRLDCHNGMLSLLGLVSTSLFGNLQFPFLTPSPFAH